MRRRRGQPIDMGWLLTRSDAMPSGCIEWRGSVDRKGYGRINVGDRSAGVHRLACEAAHGPAPAAKTWALHRCDNPPCINPDHLYWGDAKDNTRDMLERGHATGGRAGATHCVNGHEFTAENTYWEPRGWGRACKECRRQRVREFRQRRSLVCVS